MGKINRMALRLVLMAGMVFIAFVSGGTDAMAQRWEIVLGDPVCKDAGRGGVRQTTDGGYITVGETFGPTCGSSDIYVTRVNNDGTLFWSARYNIGLNDSALDVEEVRNDPNGVGGYIITGVTDQLPPWPTPCDASRDIFLLRIDRCGTILWMRTYGHRQTDDMGWDVVEATTGSPALGTNPGDFIVAGWRILTNGVNRDGYIMRVTSTGNCIWGSDYDSPTNQDDYFYSVDESTVGVAGTGDIIAAGGTNSVGAGDGWIVRVNGNTGAVVNSCTYGGSRFEEFRSVIELSMGAVAGSIVAVGTTSSTSQNLEAYLIRVPAGLGAPIAQRTLGDGGTLPDEALWVREVGNPAGTETNIIVTGYVTPPTGVGFGGADVFLQEYIATPLAPVAPVTTIYGGIKADWGWSVSPTVPIPQCVTSGYVICGFTQSQLDPNFPNDPEQLYFIKTDAAKSSNCERIYNASDRLVTLPHMCQTLKTAPFCQWCQPPIEKAPLNWLYRDCFTADGTCLCPPEPCAGVGVNGARWNGAQPGNDAAPNNRPAAVPSISENVIELDNGGIATYPNPIPAGATFTLNYAQKETDMARVVVSDLLGKVIYTESFASTMGGEESVPVNTMGWAKGTYIVKVTTGDASYTKRIVIEE